MSLRKDLHYSLGKIKTDVWSKLAKQNPLQTPDTKALSLWIFEERNDLAALRLSAYHQQETRKAFLSWIEEESKGDNEDITDIGEKLAALMEKQQEIENDYIKRYRRYRQIIKSIRERDQTVLSSERERKKSLEARIQHLQKTNPSSKQIAQFEQELSQLRQSVQEKENQMNDYKRFALREAFHLKFNAMQEYAEKSALLASFGKYLVDLLDIAPGPRPPYDKHREADMIVTDCMLAVDGWHPPQARPSTLLSYLEHDKQEDAQLLTDEHIEETLPAYDAATMINEGTIEDEKTALEKYLTTVDYNQLYQRIIQGKKK